MAPTIRVTLRVPVGRPLPELATFIARCEDAGLDGVGIHDHPSSGRDAYLALALAAQATKRLRLFPATSSPFLDYPSASNLRWLKEAGFELAETHDPAAIPEDQAQRIADAFGLFGSPERCAERLLQAREEAGVDHVFLFPAHDLAGGYEMPEAELRAFAKVIRPRL